MIRASCPRGFVVFILPGATDALIHSYNKSSGVADMLRLDFLGSLMEEDIPVKGRKETFPPDAIIYRQGERAERSFLLEDGVVKISVVGADGEEQTLCYVEKGRLFYDPGFILEKPNGASAKAVTGCTVISFCRWEHLELVHRCREFAELCLISQAEQMRDLGAQVAALALNDRFGLVARSLLYFGRRSWSSEAKMTSFSTSSPIKVFITQEELADFTGINRVTVANVLRVLAEKCIIEKRPREITILQPEELYRLAAF